MALVVKDYQFNSEVAYEKIEDLFLIEESGPEEEVESTTTTIAGKSAISKSFLYYLEIITFLLPPIMLLGFFCILGGFVCGILADQIINYIVNFV